MMQRYRTEQTFYFNLAQLQPEGSKEREEAFNDFRKKLFPHIIRSDISERDRIREILERAYAQGPILVTLEE